MYLLKLTFPSPLFLITKIVKRAIEVTGKPLILLMSLTSSGIPIFKGLQ